MRVYALTNGCYSDYRVVALFSTKTRAEKAMGLLASPESPTIQEYEIDDPSWASVPCGYKVWMMWVYDNGNLRYTPHQVNPNSIEAPHWIHGWRPDLAGVMCLYAIARDEKHAMKIASETRAQMIASGEWERRKTGGAA